MTSKPLEIIYCCDHWPNRAKTNGARLTDQALLSIGSLRENWNPEARVWLLHTLELPSSVEDQLNKLKVQAVRCGRSIEPEHLMANKILPVHIASRERDQLFLDCDTIVHQPVFLDRDADILVAYDALTPMSLDVYEEAFALLGLDLPPGSVYPSPVKQFYDHGDTSQFPVWNAGVFYLNGLHRRRFYKTYLRSFRQLFARFKHSAHHFYIETLAFTATVLLLDLNVSYLPKGVNFICTPRADALSDWPRSKIVVEHYAGNTSAPLEFDGEAIIRSWAPPVDAVVYDKCTN